MLFVHSQTLNNQIQDSMGHGGLLSRIWHKSNNYVIITICKYFTHVIYFGRKWGVHQTSTRIVHMWRVRMALDCRSTKNEWYLLNILFMSQSVFLYSWHDDNYVHYPYQLHYHRHHHDQFHNYHPQFYFRHNDRHQHNQHKISTTTIIIISSTRNKLNLNDIVMN
jgi:hypothetical protein